MDREDRREIANEVVWGLLRRVLAILLIVGGLWLIYASGIIGAIFDLVIHAIVSWYQVLIPILLTWVIIVAARR